MPSPASAPATGASTSPQPAACKRPPSPSSPSASARSRPSSRRTTGRCTATSPWPRQLPGQVDRPGLQKKSGPAPRPGRAHLGQANGRAIRTAARARPARSTRRKSRPSKSRPSSTTSPPSSARPPSPPKNTLALAQALYERHKMLTYPRTDSRYLPEDYIAKVKAPPATSPTPGTRSPNGPPTPRE